MAAWIFVTQRVDLYNKSRMTGDCHVRFCERLGVKFPLPTRLTKRCPQCMKKDRLSIKNLKIFTQ